MAVSDFVAIINQLLPEPEASLLAGMLFGVRRSMPPSFYQALITTGTLHVVALSGFNISIIMRLLYEFCAGMFGRLVGSLLTILGIGSFVFFVGLSPTVVRAALMGSMTVLAAVLGRRDIPILSLFLTGFLMVFWDFKILGNLSFQLSFLATLGIILFGGHSRLLSASSVPRKKGRSLVAVEDLESKLYSLRENSPKPLIINVNLRRRIFHSLFRGTLAVWQAARTDLRVTLSAQVFTLPVILYNFQRISLISPLANVFTGWLVAPITYLGFLVVLLGWVWWPAGRVSSLGLWVLLKIFVVLVGLFAKFPLASIEF